MAFEIWGRAVTKWRGLITYILLQTAARSVSSIILMLAESPGMRLYASLVTLTTTSYCLWQLFLLLTKDREGDDKWPAVWT